MNLKKLRSIVKPAKKQNERCSAAWLEEIPEDMLRAEYPHEYDRLRRERRIRPFILGW